MARGSVSEVLATAAVAKNGSARWVYLPAALAGKVGEYCAADRTEVVASARSRGAYGGIRDPLVIEGTHPGAVLRRPGGGEVRVKLEQLMPAERGRLLIRTPRRAGTGGFVAGRARDAGDHVGLEGDLPHGEQTL